MINPKREAGDEWNQVKVKKKNKRKIYALSFTSNINLYSKLNIYSEDSIFSDFFKLLFRFFSFILFFL